MQINATINGLRTKNQIIAEIFKNPLSDSLSSLYSNEIDKLIITLAKKKLEKNKKVKSSIALLATGSYGRGHMNPESDIDLIILAKNKYHKELIKIAEEILYSLWDSGFDASCTVKDESNCLAMLNKKLEIRSTLVDLRFLYGNNSFFSSVNSKILSEFRENVESFAECEIDESAKRWARFMDSSYILEPNIKLCKGGIRDLNTVFWAGRIKYDIVSYRDLVTSFEITNEEWRILFNGFRFYDKIRNLIHLATKRRDDRLTYDLQEEISLKLNYRDTVTSYRIENFMRDYFRCANSIAYLSLSILERISGKYKRLHKVADLDIFENLSGFLRAKQSKIFEDPIRSFEAFEKCQRYSLCLHPETKKAISTSVNVIDEKAINNRNISLLFRKILSSSGDVYRIIMMMHEIGLIGRYIPEFGKIIARYQFDKCHVYTVDIHSLKTLKELENFRIRKSKKIYFRIAKRINNYFILYFSALLHDIGKVFKANHQKVGGEMARSIAKRLYLSDDESKILSFLIENHTYMHHIATRRDIYSDNSISEFIKKLEHIADNDKDRLQILDSLYLLTIADIMTVGSEILTDWRERLIYELYKKTKERISGKEEKGERFSVEGLIKVLKRRSKSTEVSSFIDSLPYQYFKDLLYSTKRIIENRLKILREHFELCQGILTSNPVVVFKIEEEISRVSIVTYDQVGLFSRISGTFTYNNINIIRASIYTRTNGEVLDLFTVNTPLTDKERRLLKFSKDLKDVLENKINLEDSIKRRKEQRVRTKHELKIRNEVIIENGLSDKYTIIDIHTYDRIGLLYDITSLLSNLRIDIFLSKISTAAARVSDTFYVTRHGKKIIQVSEINELKKSLYKFLM